MSTRRKHLGIAALDGMIYAVGGRDENTELNSVERYACMATERRLISLRVEVYVWVELTF